VVKRTKVPAQNPEATLDEAQDATQREEAIGLGLSVSPEGFKRADGSVIPRRKMKEEGPPIVRLTNEPRCPSCKERLDLVLKRTLITVGNVPAAKSKQAQRALATYCSNCGHTFLIAPPEQ